MNTRELAILGIATQYEKIGGKINMGWHNEEISIALIICGNKKDLISYLTKDTKSFHTKELYRIGHLLQTGNYVKASYNLDNASRIEKWSQEI